MREKFWERVPLEEMTHEEWEALCDGCGRCCLYSVEDEHGVLYETTIACKLLDTQTCRCSDYPDRHAQVPHCIVLTPETVGDYHWLPDTCAYRRLAAGQPLAWWHPLRSGDPELVHTQYVSLRGAMISEEYVHPDDFILHLLRDEEQ